MNTEVGQDSILGPILESKQMWMIRTEELEQVFLGKAKKPGFPCWPSEGLTAYSSRPIPMEPLPQGHITSRDPCCRACTARLPPAEVRQHLRLGPEFLPVLAICKATNLTF